MPGCGFDAPHAGRHGQPQRPPGRYCAPLRCYCGGCAAPVEPVAEPLTLDQLRELARAETARYRARAAIRAQLSANREAVGLDAARQRAAAERARRDYPRGLMTAAARIRAA